MALLHYMLVLFLTILTLPVQLAVACVILLFSGPPVFFFQKRIGFKNRPFMLYKFRSMRVGAEKLQARYKKLNEADGPVFKIHNDPRLTIVGRFLRHTGLDELPQLFNILSGDMSLIGPRPLPISEANKLTTYQKRRHLVKPGIISPWILTGYHSQSFASWMKSDLEYVSNKSFFIDFLLFIKSISLLFRLIYTELLGL